MVGKWESERLFTFGSITFIIYGSHQNDPIVNSPSLSHFTTTLTLEDPNQRHILSSNLLDIHYELLVILPMHTKNYIVTLPAI